MDDYDYEETDDSTGFLQNLGNSLLDLGTQAASGYLQNSSIAAQPAPYQPAPYVPAPASSGSLMLILLLALVAFVIYEVL